MVSITDRFVSGDDYTIKASNFVALHADSNTQRTGVGTRSPDRTLHVKSGDATVLKVESTSSASPVLELTGTGGTGTITYNSSTGAVTFGTDATRTTLSVDVLSIPDGSSSAARLAIGDSEDIRLYHQGGNNWINAEAGPLYLRTNSAQPVIIRTNNAEAIRFDGTNQLVTCSKGLTVNTTAASSALTVADGTSITTLSTSTSAGSAALVVDQNDADEPFINYAGTSSAGTADNISTFTTGASIQGFVRVSINGTDRWMPFYDAPTS